MEELSEEDGNATAAFTFLVQATVACTFSSWIWPQSAGWMQDDGDVDELEDVDVEGTSTADNRGYDPGAAEDDSNSCYVENVGFSGGLYDAKNAFGMMIRYRLLWNVAHRWNKASCFVFNRYSHWGG